MLSDVRSTKLPFKSSIMMEFFLTTVSVSVLDSILNTTIMLITNITILVSIIPVIVASVNLKKSFIVLILFVC
ncbi:hypothetical protein SDC9_115334 [bioreactor metagenome]|uniref:Uncharacterized protein n=1 Tax=bioreactor metagenome TaxID=1076179 RepID=A0A645BT31_9ZZZZ